jgi:hypothetical protein
MSQGIKAESERMTNKPRKKAWSDRRSGRVIILLSFAGLFALMFWMAMRSRRTVLTNGGLIVDNKDLNFGEILENGQNERILSIANPTSEDIQIEQFSSSCGCLSVKPEALLIPSGGSQDIRVSINVGLESLKNGRDVSDNSIKVELIPKISHLEPYLSHSWTIEGRIRTLFNIEPHSIDFGILREGERYLSKTVHLTSSVPLDKLTVVCPPDLGSAMITKSKAGENRFEIKITPSSKLPQGRFHFNVTIKPAGAHEERIPFVTIPIEGIVRGDFQLLPQDLILGATRIGQSVTEEVVIFSRTSRPYEVLRVDTVSNDTTVEPGPPSEASLKLFRVTQRIFESGMHTRSVRFLLCDSDKKLTYVFLNLSYLGVLADRSAGGQE